MKSVAVAPGPGARNACKLCAPLGACLAFRGVEGCVPFLHGSQGCATYIRRYMISHFKEPLDIASSSFGEASVIFGGRDNLKVGLDNVIHQYTPAVIGLATTCLAETIGDDVAMYLHEYRRERGGTETPPIVHVSTPAYTGTHAEGYHAAVRALLETFAEGGAPEPRVNLLPGLLSPADLRHLAEILADFGRPFGLLPDYSDPLDGPSWEEYQRIPPGGTPLRAWRAAGRARATVEFGLTRDPDETAGAWLEERFGVRRVLGSLPIGLRQTDALFATLEEACGVPTPPRHAAERGRLVDAYVDAHKHVFGARAVVFGEEDLVAGVAGFLSEIGVTPALCASGGCSGRLKEAVAALTPDAREPIRCLGDADFTDIEAAAAEIDADLIIGSSKGYAMARELGKPLIRIGFPIHDRVGGGRVLHVGYRGAQQLFDRVCNALIEIKQDASAVGYTYM